MIQWLSRPTAVVVAVLACCVATALGLPDRSSRVVLEWTTVESDTHVSGHGTTGPQHEAPGTLVLHRVDSKTDELRLAFPLQEGFFTLPSGSVWSVHTEMEGFWSPGAVLSVEVTPKTVWRLELYATGVVAGSLEVEQGAQAPRSLWARFRRPARARNDASGTSEGQTTCTLSFSDDEKAANWSYLCEVPAGTWDLALIAPGFVPQYFWDVSIPKEGTRPIPLSLTEGASLSGFVTPGTGVQRIERANAILTPKVGRRSLDGLTSRALSTEVRTQVRENGFFLFEGIQAGVYTLEIEHPEAATARLSTIQVLPKAETHLTQTLELRRPFSAALRLKPARDWLDRRWRVLVFQKSELTGYFDEDPIYSGSAGIDGSVQLPPLAPGVIDVKVSDSLDNRFLSSFVELTGPEDSPQLLEIQMISVAGEVFLGEEPLAATLWLGGRYGSQRVKAESDSDGQWSAILPKDGGWKVEIHSLEPRLSAKVRVEVEPNRDAEAEVVIRLPNTEVFGTVLDDRERPVARAIVSLETKSQTLQETTDSGGEFTFRGVDEGQAALEARFGERVSEPAFPQLEESIPTGPVILRLADRKLEDLALQVRSTLGPVAAAKVYASVLEPPMSFGTRTHTGLDGRGTVRVPSNADVIQLTVLPPGLALRAFRVDLPTEGADLFVPQEGGDLEVSLAPHREDHQALILQGDLVLEIAALGEWQMGHGGGTSPHAPIRFPRLAPGPYRLCQPRREDMVSAAASGRSWREAAVDCEEGFLDPGGLLRLGKHGEQNHEEGKD